MTVDRYFGFSVRFRACVLVMFGFAAVCRASDGFVLDTTAVYDIQEVVVTENYRNSETRSTAPLQILSQKKLATLNALQVSDAVKYFSGVTVKDYGGIGGLKTVSVRSLGAAHTAVSYNGMTLSDCQNGQIDIGRISLENVDMLSLANGQSDQIFQAARLFASAAVLNIRTAAPKFEDDRPVNGKLAMRSGSFGLLNPSAYVNVRLGDRWSVHVDGEWLYSNGQYPYLLHYGSAGTDSVSRERRQNTDVNNLRAEAMFYGSFSDTDEMQVQVYYYGSERGLPGATIYYNTLNFSSQRLWDNTFFAQAHYKKDWDKWAFRVDGKYNFGYTRYLDPTMLNSAGREENTYRQQEYYVSAGGLYKIIPNLSVSLNTDAFVNTLWADLTDFSFPVRYSWLTALAVKYVSNRVLATGSLLATLTEEQVRIGQSADIPFRLSPYASVSVQPFERVDLRVRAFYKNIFRLPTFNDLYYGRVGNPDLKPETTNQYNLGLTYSVRIGRYVPLLSFTADAYHNDVRDKIVAFPSKNIYTWTMLNYGKVSINGLDLTGEAAFYPWEKIGLSIGGTYTYQRALNVTDPDSREYGHQIPYTPRVSGSGKAALETPWVNLAYSVVWSGHRYAVNQNYAENRVPGYSDHSLSVSRTFHIGRTELACSVECLNLGGKNYEVVRYFPMPGRSWRASVQWKW